MKLIGNDWDEVIGSEFYKPYYQELRKFLDKEFSTKTIYPKKENIFNALRYTTYKDVKVVILGQDPYHEENQAHGLAFSVNKGIAIPPSLVNIYKEMKDDVGVNIPSHGYLKELSDQGVLLLNTVLTVEAHKANSHKGKGWEILTDEIIKKLNDRNVPIVFIFWGNNARSKKKYVTNPIHKVIESVHPSPLSVYNGFFGSKPFSKTNDFLIQNNLKPIDWQIH